MKTLSSAFLFLLCCAGCSGDDDRNQADPGATSIEEFGSADSAAANSYSGVPEVIGDSILRFPGGADFAPGFRNISYIGQLPAGTRAPFIIIGGVECSYCDAPPSVLMRSASAVPVSDLRSLPGWYPYPGRIVASADSTVVMSEARMFWGECLPGEPAGLLYYHVDFVDNEPGPRTVRATLIRGDSLASADGVFPWSSIEAVSEGVSAGRCHEIEPENRYGEP